MSENNCKPDANDPGSQHYVEATLNEIGRLGTKPDEEFLSRVTGELTKLESKPATSEERSNISPIRKMLPYSLAAAASISIGLLALFLINGDKQKQSGPSLAHASVEEKAPIETKPPISVESPTPAEIPVEATTTHVGATASAEIPQIATNYVIRMQEQVKRADDAALRGSRLMADGDFEGAVEQYKNGIDLLPESPMTKQRRDAYTKQFARSATTLARQYADSGRYNESVGLIEEVLRPTIAPDNLGAKRLLEQINDPEYYGAAMTPEHLERVRKVKIALQTGQGYLNYGDYDRAEREYHKALSIDRYNSAARRSLENVERHRYNYYEVARDQTRTTFLRQIAQGWESPVPASLEESIVTKDKVMRRKGPIDSKTSPGESTNEKYGQLIDNVFTSPLTSPLSTFSVDVDTASYSNIRRMINQGQAIPKDSVRIEEMINYFTYDYPQPNEEHPFAFAIETAECPWNTEHQLMRVGIQGQSMARNKRPDANLVFLIDVSGSMQPANKLPLVKQSMELLIEELTDNDTISVVVYAGSEGLCLPPTKGSDKAKIAKALGQLKSGGSTNGGAGIKLAYKLAAENYSKEGINRVILCTDGDFNVGTTRQSELVDLVKHEAKKGTYLSVLGFGDGNINDAMLEAITNHGNGNYAYVDSIREGRKVFLQDMMSTLVTIAKDVKIQVEFNPKHVRQYRLIGYANRMLEAQDFNNDRVDAGEIGAGHSVTALYEIVPAGAPPVQHQVTDRLKYQRPPAAVPQLPRMELVESDELCTVKLRYKRPQEMQSIPMEKSVTYQSREWNQASEDYQWTAATALWGMILRETNHLGDGGKALVLELAKRGIGNDAFQHREEMIELIGKWAKE